MINNRNHKTCTQYIHRTKLLRKEEALLRQRRERDVLLLQTRKLAAEKKAHFERVERRVGV